MQALAFLIIFIIGVFPSTLSQKGCEVKDRQTCRPVNALIFWDLSMVENIFSVQRHFVLQIIQCAHESTYIDLNVIDTEIRNVFNMRKDQLFNLEDTISNIRRGTSEQNIIPLKSLMATISKFTNEKETVKAATELFFVVNNKTRLDDKEIALNELKRFKTNVVFVGEGKNPPPKFWTNLATDKHHVLERNGNFNQFLNLTCKDSKLYCDTDMYWNGQECKPCTFICSKTPAEDSPYCVQECTYYRKRGNTSSQSETSGCNSLMSYTKQQLLIYTILVLKNYLLR